MFNFSTILSRRIRYTMHESKRLHKSNNKAVVNSINIQRIANVHPCIFYLVAYLGLPLGIMLTVFFAAYVAVAPLSLIMGWL